MISIVSFNVQSYHAAVDGVGSSHYFSSRNELDLILNDMEFAVPSYSTDFGRNLTENRSHRLSGTKTLSSRPSPHDINKNDGPDTAMT